MNSRPWGYEGQPKRLTHDINTEHLMIAAVVERLCPVCAVLRVCVTATSSKSSLRESDAAHEFCEARV